jgi:DNA-directed RNA polymerase subunit RPC12/RpoP
MEMSELETEHLIVTLVHENRLALLFHAKDRRYYHPERVKQRYAVVTHCQSCGASLGSEIVFAGETRRCHYCGTAIQPVAPRAFPPHGA